MKNKKDRGYIGVDVSISLVIIVILLPTIIAIAYNISKSNNDIKRKAQATSIATFVIEDIKSVLNEKIAEDFETSDVIIQNAIYTSIQNAYSSDIQGTFDTQNGMFTLKKNEVLYRVHIILESSTEDNKTFNVIVEYPLGTRQEQVTITTTFNIKE